jgi:hypothetical protein
MIRREPAEVALPATQDDLLAALVARHVSVRLLRRLAVLPRTTSYRSLDAVRGDADRRRPPSAQGSVTSTDGREPSVARG